MDGAGKELSDIEADVEVDSELQVVRASVASASLAIALSILAQLLDRMDFVRMCFPAVVATMSVANVTEVGLAQ